MLRARGAWAENRVSPCVSPSCRGPDRSPCPDACWFNEPPLSLMSPRYLNELTQQGPSRDSSRLRQDPQPVLAGFNDPVITSSGSSADPPPIPPPRYQQPLPVPAAPGPHPQRPEPRGTSPPLATGRLGRVLSALPAPLPAAPTRSPAPPLRPRPRTFLAEAAVAERHLGEGRGAGQQPPERAAGIQREPQRRQVQAGAGGGRGGLPQPAQHVPLRRGAEPRVAPPELLHGRAAPGPRASGGRERRRRDGAAGRRRVPEGAAAPGGGLGSALRRPAHPFPSPRRRRWTGCSASTSATGGPEVPGRRRWRAGPGRAPASRQRFVVAVNGDAQLLMAEMLKVFVRGECAAPVTGRPGPGPARPAVGPGTGWSEPPTPPAPRAPGGRLQRAGAGGRRTSPGRPSALSPRRGGGEGGAAGAGRGPGEGGRGACGEGAAPAGRERRGRAAAGWVRTGLEQLHRLPPGSQGGRRCAHGLLLSSQLLDF